MKKLLFVLLTCFAFLLNSQAQDDQKKVKKTSTLGQKIHNTFSKHKRHSGYKVKKEHNGVKHKHKVNYKTGETKNKVN